MLNSYNMLELDFICLFSRYKIKQSKKNKLSFREKNGKQQSKAKEARNIKQKVQLKVAKNLPQRTL